MCYSMRKSFASRYLCRCMHMRIGIAFYIYWSLQIKKLMLWLPPDRHVSKSVSFKKILSRFQDCKLLYLKTSFDV